MVLGIVKLVKVNKIIDISALARVYAQFFNILVASLGIVKINLSADW